MDEQQQLPLDDLKASLTALAARYQKAVRGHHKGRHTPDGGIGKVIDLEERRQARQEQRP